MPGKIGYSHSSTCAAFPAGVGCSYSETQSEVNPIDNCHELLPLLPAALGKALGLPGIVPAALGGGANLVVRLSPYAIAARILYPRGGAPGDARTIASREIRAAFHLQSCGVPVVLPYAGLEGPHPVAGTWATCWEYAAEAAWTAPPPAEAVRLVRGLSEAMARWEEPLPALGVWNNARAAAERLIRLAREGRAAEPGVRFLLDAFAELDGRMRLLPASALVPAHGDAHPRNLIAGEHEWRWIDFEDVCLMPPYWDLASYVCNPALFGGLREPVLQAALREPGLVSDRGAFAFVLSARAVMATLTNLAHALEGRGDLPFARAQLDKLGDFLPAVRKLLA